MKLHIEVGGNLSLDGLNRETGGGKRQELLQVSRRVFAAFAAAVVYSATNVCLADEIDQPPPEFSLAAPGTRIAYVTAAGYGDKLSLGHVADRLGEGGSGEARADHRATQLA